MNFSVKSFGALKRSNSAESTLWGFHLVSVVRVNPRGHVLDVSTNGGVERQIYTLIVQAIVRHVITRTAFVTPVAPLDVFPEKREELVA